MRYISTRGGTAKPLSFQDVLLAGLAPDGGLYVPESIPTFSASDIAALAALPYPELALAVMEPFMGTILPREQLHELLNETYGLANFRHRAVAPLVQTGHQEFVLELFHGPTLAFKDFALQFLGQLLGRVLAKEGRHVTVLGATSGDTGSAAIAGLRGIPGVDIYILHPHERTSAVQRRQMTTVSDENVHNIALKGTFDDCQDIVKAAFADAAFRARHSLVAVNSINWARILAQVVYYFYAALQLGAPSRALRFVVPTGNFGDIYAGYIAKRMGLPIEQLVIASNRNDILTRCLASGAYSMAGVTPSLSPSMDIQISSNFERLLFDLYGRDGALLATMMQDFRQTKSLTLSEAALDAFRRDFDAASADDKKTLATIHEVYNESGYTLDPHTAVGMRVARDTHRDAVSTVVLATAHPAKFPDAVTEATGLHPALPAHMADLFEREERFDVLENSAEAVKEYIRS